MRGVLSLELYDVEAVERAVIMGDVLLGKAVLWRAIEIADGQLISAYLSEYPEDRWAVEDFRQKSIAYNTLLDDGSRAL
jgi:hypothetical protein